MRHNVAASMLAELRPLGAAFAPGQGVVEACALAAAATPGATRPSAPRQCSNAAAGRALRCFLALLAARGKCRNRCRLSGSRSDGPGSRGYYPAFGGSCVGFRSALPDAEGGAYPSASPLGGRPMAGHQVLVLRIGVRIPAP